MLMPLVIEDCRCGTNGEVEHILRVTGMMTFVMELYDKDVEVGARL